MHVENAAIVFTEDFGDVKTRAGGVPGIKADADSLIPCVKKLLHRCRVAVRARQAVVVDRQLDVVLFDELFEVVPLRHFLGFNDDEFYAHELGELKQLSVVFLLHGSTRNAKRVTNQPVLIEDGLLALD